MSWIGLDIGGANLKFARPADGLARSLQFALWREPQSLKNSLLALTDGIEVRKAAITMTGELCDCFESRDSGVRHIVRATRDAFPKADIRYWTIGQTWFDDQEAAASPRAVASANWMASASLVASHFPSDRVCLVDMGSTTTDIIPIEGGRVAARGKDDGSRLETGELVYTGTRRTPLMALLGPQVCAEYFATMQDARIWLGLAVEHPDSFGADGRPLTRALCRNRLARMAGNDGATIEDQTVTRLARKAMEIQKNWVSNAIGKVFCSLDGNPDAWVVAGEGEGDLAVWIRERAPKSRIVYFDEIGGKGSSSGAAAVSVARLAEKVFGQ